MNATVPYTAARARIVCESIPRDLYRVAVGREYGMKRPRLEGGRGLRFNTDFDSTRYWLESILSLMRTVGVTHLYHIYTSKTSHGLHSNRSMGVSEQVHFCQNCERLTLMHGV